MKKVIGNLNGHPIVVGDENEVTKNEYLYKNNNGVISLFKRNLSNKLECFTQGQGEPEAEAYILQDDTLDLNTVDEINSILSE